MHVPGRTVAGVLTVLAIAAGLFLPLMACARASTWPPAHIAAVVAYDIGRLVCHQRPERSFASCGRAWPVCGRCSGIYLGAAAGALLMMVALRSGRETSRGIREWRRVLLLAAAPTAVLMAVEYLGRFDPGTPVRFAGALSLGLAGGAWLAASARQDLR
jgi:uncharacterized membrane protein